MVSNAYPARKYIMFPFDALLDLNDKSNQSSGTGMFRNELILGSQSYDPKGSQIILTAFVGSKSNEER